MSVSGILFRFFYPLPISNRKGEGEDQSRQDKSDRSCFIKKESNHRNSIWMLSHRQSRLVKANHGQKCEVFCFGVHIFLLSSVVSEWDKGIAVRQCLPHPCVYTRTLARQPLCTCMNVHPCPDSACHVWLHPSLVPVALSYQSQRAPDATDYRGMLQVAQMALTTAGDLWDSYSWHGFWFRFVAASVCCISL